jgi:hypothetical protein
VVTGEISTAMLLGLYSMVAKPEDMIAQRFDDEALEELGILRAGAEEPGAQGIPRVAGHGTESEGRP